MEKGAAPKPLSEIDPTKVTVNQWLDTYEKTRGVSMTTRRKDLKLIMPDQMDKPLVEVVKFFKNAKKHPLKIQYDIAENKGRLALKEFQDQGMSVSSDELEAAGRSTKTSLQTSINNLQAQIKLSLGEYDKQYNFGDKQSAYKWIDVTKDWELTRGVPKVTGKSVKIEKFKFRPEFMGHRTLKLMEYIKDNPEYQHAFRAEEFQLHSGMRSKELFEMSPYDLRGALNVPGGEVPSIHLDKTFTKMSRSIDVPAHPRIYNIFQQQLRMLEKHGLLSNHLPYLWVNPAPNVVYNYNNTLDVAKAKAENPDVKIIKTSDPKLKGLNGFTRIDSTDLNHLNKQAPVMINGIGIMEDVRWPLDHPNREMSTLDEPRSKRHILTMKHSDLNIGPIQSGQMLSRNIGDATNPMYKTYGGGGHGKATGMHSQEDIVHYKRTSDSLLAQLNKYFNVPEGMRIADNVDLVDIALNGGPAPITKTVNILASDGKTYAFNDIAYENQKYYTRKMKNNQIIGHVVHTPDNIELKKFNSPVDVDTETIKISDVWKESGDGTTSSEKKLPPASEEMSQEERLRLKTSLFKGNKLYNFAVPSLMLKSLFDFGKLSEEDKDAAKSTTLAFLLEGVGERIGQAGLMAAKVGAKTAATTAMLPSMILSNMPKAHAPDLPDDYDYDSADAMTYRHIESEKKKNLPPEALGVSQDKKEYNQLKDSFLYLD